MGVPFASHFSAENTGTVFFFKDWNNTGEDSLRYICECRRGAKEFIALGLNCPFLIPEERTDFAVGI